MRGALAGRARVYLEWVINEALPFWASGGFDTVRHRFHERLDFAGRPLDVPQRAMVQSRQIYVYAHAAKLGWFEPGAELASRALESLLRTYGSSNGRTSSFIFSVDGAGRPLSTDRDAYTHAFVLLAIAWVYQLTGDAALLVLAERIIGFIDSELTDVTHGGLYDAAPITVRTKRQNPLMHFLEAYLALEAAAPGRGYRERASQLVELLDRRLVRDEYLIEHFDEAWTFHPDVKRAHVFEPGHHFEWCWLLSEYDRLCQADTTLRAGRLHATARDCGISDHGLIHDELNTDRVIIKSSHRVWPHTEAIKAAVAQERAGAPGSRELAEAMAGTLLENFVGHPFAGGWIDHLDDKRRPLVDYVPASTLYHLFVAATELASREPSEAIGARDQLEIGIKS